MATLSASLIVKNEERFLHACLSSLVGQVDEIIVVDTGSTDRSPDIARECGARLLQFPWNSSFADPRNVALDACSGDWILYIDADERLVLDGDARIVDLLRTDAWAGAMVRFRPKSGFTRCSATARCFNATSLSRSGAKRTPARKSPCASPITRAPRRRTRAVGGS